MPKRKPSITVHEGDTFTVRGWGKVQAHITPEGMEFEIVGRMVTPADDLPPKSASYGLVSRLGILLAHLSQKPTATAEKLMALLGLTGRSGQRAFQRDIAALRRIGFIIRVKRAGRNLPEYVLEGHRPPKIEVDVASPTEPSA